MDRSSDLSWDYSSCGQCVTEDVPFLYYSCICFDKDQDLIQKFWVSADDHNKKVNPLEITG